MPQVMTGTFTGGPNKGRRWEIYRDDRSPTGWVRKNWDPYDPNQTPYFENFNAAAADVDEQTSAQMQADAAAQAARVRAVNDAKEQTKADTDVSRVKYRDERTAVADTQWNRQQTEVERAARDRLAQLREAVAEQAREHDQTYGLDVRKQQASEIEAGARMRGPLDWAQGDAYAQGISSLNGGISPFVAALRGGTNVPYGGGTATQGNPTPLTMSTMASRMGYGSGGDSGGTDAYGRPRLSSDVQAGVDAASSAYQSGLANKPLGWMEQMTQDQRDALHSAGDYLGRNTRAEDEYYRRSRPGQGDPRRG